MANRPTLNNRLFTYGTLKSGQPNSNHMADGTHGKCNFVGTARTEVEFPLVIATQWNIPLLLHSPGDGQVSINLLF